VASSLVNLTNPAPHSRRGPGDAASTATHPATGTPPDCPVCQCRLVILAARTRADAQGPHVRRQLWGCPGGHATASYVNGVFAETELLPFSR